MSGAEMKSPFIPEEWSDAATSVSSSSLQPVVALVCGPKNSGKSTFSRNLVEVLLRRYKRVAYLDTDVGQPEFTPPGFLSLTVVDNSILGWVKGIGYDLLVDVLRYVSPSHVVKINISVHGKNLPDGLFWLDGNDDETAHLIEIQSAYQDSFNRSVLIQKDARLMRDTRIIAYFRQCIKGKEVNTIKELTHELASLAPYEVPISSLTINHLHCQIPSSEVFYSLNASIVGLGVSSDVFEDLPSCVGLGIVRGIDTERGILYVITPVAENVVEKVDLLLQGHIQLPTCLLEVKDYRSPYLSPNVLAST
ncbi:unnamed protein product [Thlaspi arvense]|uniref:Uncharacterized protein n=1 Tax=Thlaspi arvense TaxID=13288 RepID=A0AAU9SVA8_THLAR|nr:unnamed protein product [Thlaspi arvense]